MPRRRTADELRRRGLRQWRCPTCGRTGWAENAQAAYVAGTRHYIDEHDQKGTE